MHDLLTTGTFISFYTDERKLIEFVTAALQSIPGVERCVITVAEAGSSEAPPQRALPDNAGSYEVELRSGDSHYGRVTLMLDEPVAFRPFQAAVHNVASTIAVRIQSLRYQTHLEKQVQQKTRELQLSNSFLESIFDHTGDVLFVLDRDYHIVRANRMARELYSAQVPVTGNICFNAIYGRRVPCAVCPVREAIQSGSAQEAIVPYPNADNPERWFTVSAFPILDEQGEVINVIESGRDITHLKALQDELTHAVEQKAMLLREVHHRVKNNFNLIMSVLNLQFGSIPGKRVATALQDSLDRIRSMALVHQFFYRSDSQKSLDFHLFVEHLLAELSKAYVADRSITIDMQIPDIQIGMDRAVPVGLIINELVTNAFKYAFPEDRAGTIRIRLEPAAAGSEASSTVQLTVEDDGVGLPADFSHRTDSSLGMTLIQALTEQIEGTLEICDTPPGTTFTIQFPRESS
ncbi:MAG: sensor histidine kinase [Alkalispirochaeta sp.]